MTVTFFGMLVGLGLDISIAVYFGLNGAADAVVVSLTLPLLVDIILREGTKYSLVPLFVRMRKSSESYHSFVSSIYNLFLITGLMLGVVFYYFSSSIIYLIAPGLNPEFSTHAIELLKLTIPIIIITFGNAILMAFLNTNGKMMVIASRNMVVPLFAIIFLVYKNIAGDPSVRLILGYVSGFVVYFAILFVVSNRVGFNYSVLAWPKISWFYNLLKNAGLPLLTFVVRQLMRIFERIIASTLMPGSVVSYYLAYRLYSAIVNLIGSSIATTSVSTLSEQALKSDPKNFSSHFKQKTKILIVLGTFVTLAIFTFGTELIGLVYGYGNFDAADVEVTSNILKWMCISLVLSLHIPMLQITAYIAHRHNMVFLITLLAVSINVILAIWLVSFHGVAGLAVAFSISVLVEYLLLFLISKRHHTSLKYS